MHAKPAVTNEAALASVDAQRRASRRHFLTHVTSGLGTAALMSLLGTEAPAKERKEATTSSLTHFAPRAKRVIFLLQSGAPSQLDLFDPKPLVEQRHGQQVPESVRMGQRLTTMTSDQQHKLLTASPFQFAAHGRSGIELSELLPHTAGVVDELCLIRSMYTEAINHDPAITFLQTGSEQPGRPSMGSWVSYGLGSESEDLPGFVVLLSGAEPGDQPLYGRLWGNAFLPGRHQGVKFRGGVEPVLYLSNPQGIDRPLRRDLIDGVNDLNRLQFDKVGDPAIEARIDKFELAYQMQDAVPRVADLSNEPAHTFELYGQDAKQPGTFAANCLLARRLAERGVRFIQLYHRGWDHHDTLVGRMKTKCQQTDQASAALVADLAQRGLLDDTLIVWGGEFGRTVFCQGELSTNNWGRDHHPRCFSMWLAGGGVRGGLSYGKTDDFSYNVTENPVHVHDLQATILHCLGLDHERLTYRFQGREHRLTDVAGRVVDDILA